MKLRYTLRAARQIERALDDIARESPQGVVSVRSRILTIATLLQQHPLGNCGVTCIFQDCALEPRSRGTEARSAVMTVPGLDPGIVPVIHVGEPSRGIRLERLAEAGERADVEPLDE